MQLNKNSKIFLAGHNGMVGSSIYKHLKKNKYKNIYIQNKKKLNLINQNQTVNFIKKLKPQFVIIAAARVGGILANNKYKANFIYENLMIQTNLIHASYLAGVKKLIFLGSSCIYPKFAKQPIKEDYLLSGKLEPTNDAYAIAKISGVKMCDAYNKQYGLNYICLMPTNLYGPNDNYDLNNSHFYPALISKIYNAKIKKKKSIEIWGTGKPVREWLYVEDGAKALVKSLNLNDGSYLFNVGINKGSSINEISDMISHAFNWDGNFVYDSSKPDGVMKKTVNGDYGKRLLDWAPEVKLNDGIKKTVDWYIKNYE